MSPASSPRGVAAGADEGSPSGRKRVRVAGIGDELLVGQREQGVLRRHARDGPRPVSLATTWRDAAARDTADVEHVLTHGSKCRRSSRGTIGQASLGLANSRWRMRATPS